MHHCSSNPKVLANQSLLMAAYMVIYRGYSALQAWNKFERIHNRIIPYCHAGGLENGFEIEVIDCLRAIQFLLQNRLYLPEEFDCGEYYNINKLDKGDMSWIIPG